MGAKSLTLITALSGFAAEQLVESAAYTALNNYLYTGGNIPPPDASSGSTSKLAPKGKKKLPSLDLPKTAKKAGLSKLSSGIGAGLMAVAAGVQLMRSGMLDNAQSLSAEKQADNDTKKAAFPDSPLLRNQLELKEGVNDLVDAINANTIASATFLAPINSSLSAISSTLIAISSTLLEISDNYATQLETADDLPYIDSDTFYDLLQKKGGDIQIIRGWQSGEKALVQRLSDSGASYSDIKQAITDYRKTVVPSETLLNVQTAVAGVTSPSPIDSSGKPIATPQANIDYTQYYQRMANAKDAELEHFNYLKNPVSPIALHTVGNVSEVSPRDAKHAKDFELARGESDTNSLGGDVVSELEDIFDGDELNGLKLFSFMGISSGFAHLNSESGEADLLQKINDWMKQ